MESDGTNPVKMQTSHTEGIILFVFTVGLVTCLGVVLAKGAQSSATPQMKGTRGPLSRPVEVRGKDRTEVPPGPGEPATRHVPIPLTAHLNARIDQTWHTAGTSNSLSELGTGERDLGGVTFQVEGVVQLSAQIKKSWASQYPVQIKDIAVGLKCRRLHFLHSTGVAEHDGTPVGEYAVHYVDGRVEHVYLLYGRHLRDWWFDPKGTPQPSKCPVVWTGTSPASKKANRSLRLYKTTWTNPYPEVEIRSVDFVSLMAGSAPFLLAMTADVPTS